MCESAATVTKFVQSHKPLQTIKHTTLPAFNRNNFSLFSLQLSFFLIIHPLSLSLI